MVNERFGILDSIMTVSYEKFMNPFSLLVKPASSDCNLCCEYCFYLPKCNLYPQTKKYRMQP
ncbi:hypothetical protein [Desulfobacula sp.]